LTVERLERGELRAQGTGDRGLARIEALEQFAGGYLTFVAKGDGVDRHELGPKYVILI
jgi:hypothetical protein